MLAENAFTFKCLLITQKPYIVSALFPFKEPHQE